MLTQFIKAGATSRISTGLLCYARRPTVSVITYHRINANDGVFPGLDVGSFREQMRWVKNRCRPLHADEFAYSLAGERSRIPRVLVTFDDGYRDLHDVAFPILEELGIPSLVFLATSLMDSGDLLWTDMLCAAVSQQRRTSARLPTTPDVVLPLTGNAEKRTYLRKANQQLKRLGNAERVVAQESLLRDLGVDRPQDSVVRQMLTWDEVRAMMPLATFGGHTHEHPILSSLDPAAQRADIATSTDTLRRELGSPPHYFAYPNGTRDDFTEETKCILTELGYELAFTTIPGLNGPSSDRLALARQPTAGSSVYDFAWLILGLSSDRTANR